MLGSEVCDTVLGSEVCDTVPGSEVCDTVPGSEVRDTVPASCYVSLTEARAILEEGTTLRKCYHQTSLWTSLQFIFLLDY